MFLLLLLTYSLYVLPLLTTLTTFTNIALHFLYAQQAEDIVQSIYLLLLDCKFLLYCLYMPLGLLVDPSTHPPVLVPQDVQVCEST